VHGLDFVAVANGTSADRPFVTQVSQSPIVVIASPTNNLTTGVATRIRPGPRRSARQGLALLGTSDFGTAVGSKTRRDHKSFLPIPMLKDRNSSDAATAPALMAQFRLGPRAASPSGLLQAGRVVARGRAAAARIDAASGGGPSSLRTSRDGPVNRAMLPMHPGEPPVPEGSASP